MNLLYIAILALGAFVAVWIFFVVPAERKHHARKLAALQKRIEERQAAKQEDDKYAASNPGDTSVQGDEEARG